MSNDLFIPDSLLPCDNELEVPTLDINMQPKFCDIPFVLWGEQRRTFKMNGCGTLHFYTDGYRFGDSLYQHPEKILQHNPANIVEPNYSLFNETPIAFVLQAIYKKRFIARAMQRKGIKVFADLNVASKFYKLNLIGIPRGYGAFCTRGNAERLNYLAFELEIAKMIADGNPLLFVCYGGGEPCKKFCRENGLVYVSPIVNVKNKIKSFEKIKESIAFFGKEISPLELMPSLKELPTMEDVSKENVFDFSKKLGA